MFSFFTVLQFTVTIESSTISITHECDIDHSKDMSCNISHIIMKTNTINTMLHLLYQYVFAVLQFTVTIESSTISITHECDIDHSKDMSCNISHIIMKTNTINTMLHVLCQ